MGVSRSYLEDQERHQKYSFFFKDAIHETSVDADCKTSGYRSIEDNTRRSIERLNQVNSNRE